MSFRLPARRTLGFALMCGLAIALQPVPGGAEPAAGRDGQHDFDFHLGAWKSEISHLQHPLTGSTTWDKCQGSLVARKVWDGRAQIEELEADCPGQHIEDLLLFLYNPESREWSLNSAAVGDGVMNRPMFGGFKDGRGEFYDQETYHSRTILVRQVWSDITPTSHHFEQAFSDDGGKTWEPNFKATLTRVQ
jgi:hypothetical protein